MRAAEIPEGGEAWVWLSNRAPDLDRIAVTVKQAHAAASGVLCEALVPADGGWTAYQLIFQPRLTSVAVRSKVEHLVHPLKVAWRSVVVV